jgi:hypothetical protein
MNPPLYAPSNPNRSSSSESLASLDSRVRILPPQPVRSQWAMSLRQEYARHFQKLAAHRRVSEAQFPESIAANGQFRGPVLSKTLLAGPEPGVNYGKLTGRAPEITAQVEQIDKIIFTISKAMFFALVDDDRVGGDRLFKDIRRHHSAESEYRRQCL